jgi:glucose-1-phosphate thymidylyltransferase
MDELIHQGCDKATIITGYLGEMVEDYIGRNYDIQVDFVVQDEMLGLGHAIWCARETFDDELMIILGDTIFDADLSLAKKSGKNSLGVKYVADPRRFGVVVESSGKIEKLVEKPDTPISNQAIVGIYYIKDYSEMRSALDHILDNNIKTKNEYQLTDALQHMIETGSEFTTFKVEGWHDCGKQETVLATNKFLLERGSGDSEGGKREGSVVIQPCHIGKGVTLKGSVIGPYTTIADGSTVSDSIVKNTIIGSDANVSGAVLQDSLIGSRATLASSFSVLSIGDSSEVKL